MQKVLSNLLSKNARSEYVHCTASSPIFPTICKASILPPRRVVSIFDSFGALCCAAWRRKLRSDRETRCLHDGRPSQFLFWRSLCYSRKCLRRKSFLV